MVCDPSSSLAWTPSGPRTFIGNCCRILQTGSRRFLICRAVGEATRQKNRFPARADVRIFLSDFQIAHFAIGNLHVASHRTKRELEDHRLFAPHTVLWSTSPPSLETPGAQSTIRPCKSLRPFNLHLRIISAKIAILGSVNPIRRAATGADFYERAKRGEASVETF